MSSTSKKHTILILGASGYLGNTLYQELNGYYNTFGTYCTPNSELENNQHFFNYDITEDDIEFILNGIKPTIIISAIRGDLYAQLLAHNSLIDYTATNPTKLIFLSSANVFDAYTNLPSYEYDKTFSKSKYGHLKIKIENQLLRLENEKVAILRLPMVFGTYSPRVAELKEAEETNTPVNLFPNLIFNVTSDIKFSQQVHYIINQELYGIFHLGSTDLVHHDTFIKDLAASLNLNKITFKQVFTTNEDRYLAVLPKDNILPKHLQLESHHILKELTL